MRADKAKATSIKNILNTNDPIAIGAMIYIQENNQTEDEKTCLSTFHRNSIGFNGADAEILGNYYKYFMKNRFLSNRQLSIIHKILPKYHNQIKNLIIEKPGRKIPFTKFQQFPIRKKSIEQKTPNIKNTECKNEDEQKTPNVKNTECKNAILSNGLIEIRFPYDSEIIAKIKTLSGRRFNSNDPKDKYWTAPTLIENIKNLRDFGFSLDKEVLSYLSEKPKPINVIPGLKKELRPFQSEGVNFIEKNRGRVLIGDEMGLGKTIQALAYLEAHPELRPAVIIVPASLKLNWEREINQTISTNNSVYIANGKNPAVAGYNEYIAKNSDIIIVNYDILAETKTKSNGVLPGWSKFISEVIKPKVVILDECHYIKSSKSNRFKEVRKICKNINHILALSGTPILNRPIEIYNITKILNPYLFPNFITFGIKYCRGYKNNWGWDFGGSSNEEELNKILTDSIMIRRLKSEVLPELPSKNKTIIPMEIDNKKEYQLAKDDFLEWLERNCPNYLQPEKAKRVEALTKIEKLKQISVKGKIKQAINWIEDFLESGEKLVVFTTHINTINQLQDKFKDIAVKVDGSVTGENRQKAVDRFQTDPSIKLFLGNLKAAGVGLTLTAASNVAFLELGWTPGEHVQAEDRVHRIGQESESINIYYLIANHTIEEKILDLINKKYSVVNSILNNNFSLLNELIKEK